MLKIFGAALIGYAIDFAGVGWRGPGRVAALDPCEGRDEDSCTAPCTFCNGTCVSTPCDCCSLCDTCNASTGFQCKPKECPAGKACCMQNGTCLSTTCPEGQTFNPFACRCLRAQPTQSPCGFCPACQRCQCDAAGSNCACVNKCGDSKPNCCNFGPEGGVCQDPCGTGKSWDANQCQCISTQSAGCQPACDPESQVCCNNRCVQKCNEGEVLDERSCGCRSLCGHPCFACAPCNPATGECEKKCKDQDFPNCCNFGPKRGTCQAACKGGKTFNQNTCTCECPRGTTLCNNGNCKSCQPPEFVDPVACVCKSRRAA